jgi:NitT/TauT family transport system substrate-binding protein
MLRWKRFTAGAQNHVRRPLSPVPPLSCLTAARRSTSEKMRMKSQDRRQFLLAGAACAMSSTLASSHAFAQAPTTAIRFSGSAAVARPDQGFMFAGITNGFYKELAIKGDFVTVAGSAATIQLLVGNQCQLGHVGMLELLAAKRNNPDLPVKAVYLQDVKSAYEIVVPHESAIKVVTDLKSKKIGVMSLASGAIPTVQAMFNQAGIDFHSAELLPVGMGAQALAALRTDRVQALALFRGSHAAIENLGVKLRYFTPDVPSSVLAANASEVERNRDGLVRALRGVVMNTVYLQTNPAAGVRSFWTLFGKPTGDEKKELEEGSRLIMRAAELWKQLGSPGRYGDMNDQTWISMLEFIGPSFAFDRDQIGKVYTSELIGEVNQADIKRAIDVARSEKM